MSHLTDWLMNYFGIRTWKQYQYNGAIFWRWLARPVRAPVSRRLRGAILAAPAATVFPLPGEWAWRES